MYAFLDIQTHIYIKMSVMQSGIQLNVMTTEQSAGKVGIKQLPFCHHIVTTCSNLETQKFTAM